MTVAVQNGRNQSSYKHIKRKRHTFHPLHNNWSIRLGYWEMNWNIRK